MRKEFHGNPLEKLLPLIEEEDWEEASLGLEVVLHSSSSFLMFLCLKLYGVLDFICPSGRSFCKTAFEGLQKEFRNELLLTIWQGFFCIHLLESF